jgi:hypothetical protein
VRRPWRGRGLAKALCADVIPACSATYGIDEAWLGVDGTNPTVALQLYEGLGFTVLPSVGRRFGPAEWIARRPKAGPSRRRKLAVAPATRSSTAAASRIRCTSSRDPDPHASRRGRRPQSPQPSGASFRRPRAAAAPARMVSGAPAGRRAPADVGVRPAHTRPRSPEVPHGRLRPDPHSAFGPPAVRSRVRFTCGRGGRLARPVVDRRPRHHWPAFVPRRRTIRTRAASCTGSRTT